MNTYKFTFKLGAPFLFIGNVFDRFVGFYGSLNSGCDLKKNGYFWLRRGLAE
jgi:hypothetical protein